MDRLSFRETLRSVYDEGLESLILLGILIIALAVIVLEGCFGEDE
jgi:hypothetical protein